MVAARYRPFVGGIETHVEEVARRLADLGVDVTVLTADPMGSSAATEVIDGVQVRRVPAWPRSRDYYLAPRMYPHVATGGWDVVHVQGYQTFVPPVAMAAALRSKLPYVATFHAGGHSSRVRNALRPTQLVVLRPLLARARRLVALADFEVDEYSRRLRLPRERFVVIPNGSDLPGPTVRHHDRDESLVASLGRLERYKGHQRLIEALPHIIQKKPDAHLWIAGSGPYGERLGRLAEALGVSDRVRLEAVERNRLAEELSRVKVVVSLSEYETQPIAALEALSLGCRLVVADTPGLSALAADGLARAIARDSRPEQVAQVVVEELDRPPVSAAPELPTWDDCARSLLELYRLVLGMS
jgi:glycosyltransferase involved in cell wall biosynthesis